MRISNAAQQDSLMAIAAFAGLAGGFSVVPAVAAQSGMAQLYLPPGSNGASLHVLGIWVSIATAGDIVIAQYDTQLATADGPGHLLTAPYASSVGLLKHASNAALQGTQTKRITLLANQSTNIINPWEYLIPQGHGLIVEAVTVNIAFTVSWHWAEIYG